MAMQKQPTERLSTDDQNTAKKKKQKALYSAASLREHRRTATDLGIAIGIAFVMALLSIAVNLSDELHSYLGGYTDYRLTALLTNFLFIWLCLLLCLAFLRWRSAVRKRLEFENIIASISPDALLVVDPQRRILMANESVMRIFGYAPHEVVNQTTDILYGDRRRLGTHSREIYEALEQDGFHVGRAEGKRRNGETLPLEIISGDLSDRSGAVLLLRDISERMKREAERKSMELQMLRADKLSSLGLLASGIAHDFNNVLMGISGNAELSLLELPEASPVVPYVKNVVHAARHAAGLCEQMLLYAGRGSIEIKPVCLSDVINDIAELLKISVPANARLDWRLRAGLPAVEADPTRLRQIVMNLVTNAADALEGATGTVTVQTDVVTLDGSPLSDNCMERDPPAGDYVSLSVADTGRGIDPQQRSKVFDPFFTTKSKGHGLGLATVAGIVRSHCGALLLESKPGTGSTFSVLLPACERGTAADAEPGHVALEPAGTVLLAEDEKMVREASKSLLEHMGFHVLAAQDGVEAVSIFERDPDAPRFLMMDVKMPNMNGIDALHAVRSIRPDVPVLMSSGHLDEETLAEIAEVGNVSFVHKPYELDTLRSRIAQLFTNPYSTQDVAG